MERFTEFSTFENLIDVFLFSAAVFIMAVGMCVLSGGVFYLMSKWWCNRD